MLLIQSPSECADFFEELCTDNEIEILSQRVEIAHLIDEGFNYNEIIEKTGASAATVSRVKRSINHKKGSESTVLKIIRRSGRSPDEEK